MAKVNLSHKKMGIIERLLRPKLINSLPKPGEEDNFTITIVSSGYVHSIPDPVTGERYFYGNPDLAKKKVVSHKRTNARIKVSGVVEGNE